MSDYESDYESDSSDALSDNDHYDSTDLIQEMEKKQKKVEKKQKSPKKAPSQKKNQSNNPTNVTTDGLAAEDKLFKQLSFETKSKLSLCDYCNKYYPAEIVFANDSDPISCWHCYFWINYDPTKRADCDGTHGVSIVDYVLKCNGDHNMAICTRNTDSGGCFLCEYKNGIQITNIKNSEKLYGISEVESQNIPKKIPSKTTETKPTLLNYNEITFDTIQINENEQFTIDI